MWVSEREKMEAKQHDAYSYLRIADPNELVRLTNREYCLRSHDSFKLSQKDGKWLWYWYSRDIGGRSAVDYLIKVKGYSFISAVREVNRVMKGICPSFFIPQSKSKTFRLPKRSESVEEIIRYLSSRGIDESIVKELINEGVIYQSKSHNSVVFVGFDDNGKPAHAAYRATQEGIASKGDCYGSNKAFAFRIERKNTDTVRVFESAIDLLSYMTLCKIWGRSYENESLISTAGIAASRNDEVKFPLSLSRYLESHPETENVFIHFDNDFAGKRLAEQIKDRLADEYNVFIVLPEQGKDYNEYLQIVRYVD